MGGGRTSPRRGPADVRRGVQPVAVRLTAVTRLGGVLRRRSAVRFSCVTAARVAARGGVLTAHVRYTTSAGAGGAVVRLWIGIYVCVACVIYSISP